ncbi:hypothetical protein ABA45_12280 [Marinobacter psychrophilus]|uniref:Uncharacterized protein n=1 Tax=Marinobacter psychrophilus TaxID=330734 RepID=A0A0H4I5S8_9GAMM|nr:hypothetical protein [Marinobacter psychrophilus]AKO53090.1 hypothetical protein ABA45_12280 [Marinobacter psychrophilus]
MTTPLADTRKPRVTILKTGATYPQIRERCGDLESWFVGGLSSVLERAYRTVAGRGGNRRSAGAGRVPMDSSCWITSWVARRCPLTLLW